MSRIEARKGAPPAPATSLDRARGELAMLSGLLESSRLLKGQADCDGLYWTVAETIMRTAGADGCTLALESETEERVVLRSEDGPERKHVLRDRILDGSRIGAAVLAEGTPNVVPRLDDGGNERFPAYVAKAGFRSAVVLPVLANDGIVGVLGIYYAEPDQPHTDVFEILVLVNQVASVALENANLYRQVQRSYFSTIEALTSAIDAASPATHGHSKRVTQFALILAESVGVESQALSVIKYGALLHDIGKLGIRPDILEKDGRLSPEEREAMMEHPVIGERIIAPVDFLQPARPIVRHHHERWDGKGYPDRLRGEEIPLGARIVALADFYDAMVSARPYKRALDPREVVREIEKERGKMFDPDLSRKFVRMTAPAR